ncbi:MAG: CapA family protein [Clostridiales bacterium]|nr:CapA family protein [Clostridiales bacterium]
MWSKAAVIVAAVCIAAVLPLTACQGGYGGQQADTQSQEAVQREAEAGDEISEAPPPDPVSLVITCVGDVMVHKSQIASQYDSRTDTYDYSNNFAYAKKYIESSDLAICNLETTFGGKPYTGYPVFSAPDELAAALKAAGFDIAVTSNNHVMDRGKAGLARTIEVLRASGLSVTGSREDPGQARYALADVKGVKVAVVAYTYASSSPTGDLLVNGSAVSEGAADLINYFRYDHMDEDLKKIEGTVAEAREAGADVVVMYYHWGDEFHLKSNEAQRRIAEKTVNEVGADIIFASHTHTPQEVGFITNNKTGLLVPVFYSMGNFISNQRVETLDAMNSKYTEIGVIASVALEYDIEGKKVTGMTAGAIPTWVDKYRSGGRDVYAVIPLDEDFEANESLTVSGHLNRARKAREDAYGILGID